MPFRTSPASRPAPFPQLADLPLHHRLIHLRNILRPVPHEESSAEMVPRRIPSRNTASTGQSSSAEDPDFSLRPSG